MLKICLVFWESEPQYAYKRYAYKKKCIHGSSGGRKIDRFLPEFGQIMFREASFYSS